MNDNIEELKQMIEPLKDWKFWEYSCTDEDVKKAMENKSYIEVVLEEQSKTIKELQQELQRKDNIINELIKYYHIQRTNIITSKKLEIYGEEGIRASTRYVVYNEILDKIKELESK